MLTSKIDTTGLGMLYELRHFVRLPLAYSKSIVFFFLSTLEW
jgi:hypothetical protein